MDVFLAFNKPLNLEKDSLVWQEISLSTGQNPATKNYLVSEPDTLFVTHLDGGKQAACT